MVRYHNPEEHDCKYLNYQNNVISVACPAYLQLLNSQLIVLVHISKLFLRHFFSNSDFTHLLLFKFQGNPQLLKLNSSLHYYQFLKSQMSARNNFSVSLTHSTITFSLVAVSHSISQEIPCHLWKPKVNYCTCNCLPMILSFSPIKKNPVHLCLGLATSLVPSGFLIKMFYQEEMKRTSNGF